MSRDRVRRAVALLWDEGLVFTLPQHGNKQAQHGNKQAM